MGKEKPLEQGDLTTPSHPSAATDWLNAFKKHFSIAFNDATSSLTDQPANEDLQQAAIVAMTSTLRDSGLSDEQMLIFGPPGFIVGLVEFSDKHITGEFPWKTKNFTSTFLV